MRMEPMLRPLTPPPPRSEKTWPPMKGLRIPTVMSPTMPNPPPMTKLASAPAIKPRMSYVMRLARSMSSYLLYAAAVSRAWRSAAGDSWGALDADAATLEQSATSLPDASRCGAWRCYEPCQVAQLLPRGTRDTETVVLEGNP